MGMVWGISLCTVLGVLDVAVLDGDTVDDVVGASADGADGDTMASSALSAGEVDILDGISQWSTTIRRLRYTYSARVDSQAVILVVDSRVGDVDTVARTNVESVGVVAILAVAIGVVNSDSTKSQLLSTADAEDLHRGILGVDVLNLGVGKAVGVEELGLLLAAVTSLAVPPAGAISIKLGPRGSFDGDGCSGNRDQRSFPFLVAESGGSFEDNLDGV